MTRPESEGERGRASARAPPTMPAAAPRPEEEVLSIDAEGGVTTTTTATKPTGTTEEPERPEEPHPEEGEGAGG